MLEKLFGAYVGIVLRVHVSPSSLLCLVRHVSVMCRVSALCPALGPLWSGRAAPLEAFAGAEEAPERQRKV